MKGRAWLRLALLAGLLGSVAAGLTAQQADPSLDDLFDGPAADTEVRPEAAAAVDHTRTLAAPEKLSWFGSFSAEGGLGAGWTDWPDPASPERYYDGTVGAEATTTLGFRARPSDYFQASGSFELVLDPLATGSYRWSGLALGELYADYYGLPDAFVRFGQFTTTWGQGRLFTPGDLMDGSGAGSTLRVTLPTLLSGVSGFILAQTAFFDDPASPGYRELGYAAQAEVVLLDTSLGLGVRYQEQEGLRLLGSFKRVLAGTDFFGDLVYARDPEGNAAWSGLAGFYRQWKNLLVYGEHEYAAGQRSALALGWQDLPVSGVDLGVKWQHAWSDGSGTVTPGVAFIPAPHLTVSAALPITYGAPGSEYVILNEDPAQRRIALVLLAALAVSF